MKLFFNVMAYILTLGLGLGEGLGLPDVVINVTEACYVIPCILCDTQYGGATILTYLDLLNVLRRPF